jgi:CHAD domain-containing protein
VDRVVAELEDGIRAIRRLRWPRDPGEIRRGLRDSQSRLRRRWTEAGEAADGESSEALHDWRKRVKDMSSQLGLFRAALPADLKAQRKTAKRVAELLGEEHDLHLLRARMAEPGLPPAVAKSAGRLIAAIDARRAELRDEALALGEAFSACRPKELARRVLENWPAAGAPKQASANRREASGPLTGQ